MAGRYSSTIQKLPSLSMHDALQIGAEGVVGQGIAGGIHRDLIEALDVGQAGDRGAAIGAGEQDGLADRYQASCSCPDRSGPPGPGSRAG
jgi:hypothetical protein